MNILITGATGFLGQALCRELTRYGHKVTAVVRPASAGKAKELSVSEVLPLSLDALDTLTGTYDVCYHLAWNGSAGEAREDYAIQTSNLCYLEKTMRAAKRCGCRKFIGAGSQAEYGVHKEKAFEYASAPAPFLMYGAAKLSCCHLGQLLAKQLGMTFVWPRIYSVYGPRKDDPTLLGYLIRTLKAGQTPQLSPCENLWDFLYLDDFTRAMRLFAECERAEGIYHVADGRQRLLKDFVTELRDLVNPGAALCFGAKPAVSERTAWLEPDLTRLKELGFAPEMTFREGVRKMLDTSEKIYDGREL